MENMSDDLKKVDNLHLLAKSKGKSRLFSSFSEILVGEVEISNFQDVIGDETLHGTSTILDGEGGAVGLVS